MELTAKSYEVFNYVKENGGKIAVSELVEALDRTARSINANVTDLQKKELVAREKEGSGDEQVTYVVMTDAGHSAEVTQKA